MYSVFRSVASSLDPDSIGSVSVSGSEFREAKMFREKERKEVVDVLLESIERRNIRYELPGTFYKLQILNLALGLNPDSPNQCCGSGSGIRCLFDPWIRDPE